MFNVRSKQHLLIVKQAPVFKLSTCNIFELGDAKCCGCNVPITRWQNRSSLLESTIKHHPMHYH